MIEEFNNTTKALAADLQEFQAFLTRENKATRNKLAEATWARFNWEQRVSLHPQVGVITRSQSTDVRVVYWLPKSKIVCRTLSQMKHGTLACGTQYPTKHVHHLHCNEDCCFCDVEF